MQVSIVIPTFNERDNVRTMVERIEGALREQGYLYEIWFIDDSRDDTPEVLEELSQTHSQVHYVHRTNGRGLGTAVVEGFARSTGKYVVVMDADLQHPPEVLPTMLKRLMEGIDVVIPSRFVPGGSDGGLNTFRKFVSWTARWIGRVAIKRLRSVSDCTGGYFGLHRSVIENAELDPIGWKILMEVLVKGHYQTVHEVPYDFRSRDAGESKMNLQEQWNYLRHIGKLLWASPEDRRFYLYCFVGALGVIVNLAVMSLVFYGFHPHAWVASVVASSVAMAHNFLWNDKLTWKEHNHTEKWRRALQMPTFVLVSGTGIAVTALFVQVFVWLHWSELMGQSLGIVIATGWTFTANNRWTWASPEEKKARQTQKKIRVTQE